MDGIDMGNKTGLDQLLFKKLYCVQPLRMLWYEQHVIFRFSHHIENGSFRSNTSIYSLRLCEKNPDILKHV